MTQWSYTEALQALWQRSAYERGSVVDPFAQDFNPGSGLIRTRRLLEAWGRPQSDFKTVHIAGSKGKGSTAAFTTSILAHGGIRTGLYSSPHLHTLRERISINGQAISERDFAALTQQALALALAIERSDPALGEFTAFEITTAMALRHFAERSCAVAVIEVGLGGIFDATNVIDGNVSVITLLDLEHTSVLGSTLVAIAQSKAGIIKPQRPVISAAQNPEALRVIEDTARQRHAPLYRAGIDWTSLGDWRSFQLTGPWGEISRLRSGLIGNHQVTNAGLAVAALWGLGTGQFPITVTAIREGVASTRWPGRYEVIIREPVRIILDGAHSPASARVLAQTIAEEEPGRAVVVVLGMLNDKDVASFARELVSVATRFVTTVSSHPRALQPDALAGVVSRFTLSVDPTPTVDAALESAIESAGRHGTVVVTGSLTTVADARVSLGLACADPIPAR